MHFLLLTLLVGFGPALIITALCGCGHDHHHHD
jgi:hypothetical protein